MRNYILKERKISSEVCKKFSLGYASKSWDALSTEMLGKGITEDILIKAGLAKKIKTINYSMFSEIGSCSPLKIEKEELLVLEDE